MHPFPLSSSTICGTHPYAFVQPLVHQGGCARGGHPGFNCQGCGGACSTSLSRLLQPSVRGLENLVVVVSGHRSLDSIALWMCHTSRWRPFSQSSFPSVRATGWPPSIFGNLTCRFQYIRHRVPSSALWPMAKYISSRRCVSAYPRPRRFSHGSWLLFLPSPTRWVSACITTSTTGSSSPPLGSLSSAISRFSGSLSGAGYCGQPREVQPRSLLGCPVSRGGPQYPVFSGFSVARSRLQALVNRRRISVLCLASRQCLALSTGDAFLHGSPRPQGETSHEISSALPSLVLGSGGPVDSCSVVPGLLSGSAVVAPPASSISGGVSAPGVSGLGLLVRRLGRRVGCSSGLSRRFRPLGRVGISSSYQRQGTAGCPSGSPPLPVVSFGQNRGGVLRQRHSRGVSSQGRGHQVSLSQLPCTGDPALVGATTHPSGSTVYSGLPQRLGGRSLTSSSAPEFRVVPQLGGLSVFASSVAGPDRFVCHLGESPLFHLFFSDPRPSVSGHGRLSPVLGWSSGVCISSVVHYSPSPSQAPDVSGDGAHSGGSVLAAEALVSGPPPAVAGTSSRPSRPSRPPVPALVSSALPGSPQATASCQGGRFLVRCSFAGFVGAPSIFAHQLPAQVVGLPFLVPFPWSFSVSSDPFYSR